MKRRLRILSVVGARPNYMKIAPVIRELDRYPEEFEQTLIHTGQHYDKNVSDIFFDELGLPQPALNLGVGSGSHAVQTAEVMLRVEKVLVDYRPDWVCVPGDVNSTLACALVAVKLGFPVAHIEAGLRSFDRSMPEEINRILTDQISDLLFTPSPDADDNLQREGVLPAKVFRVGNVMIDTLVRLFPKVSERYGLLESRLSLDRYVLVTMHRPANVDSDATLSGLMAELVDISNNIPIVFPVHPRTRKRLSQMGWSERDGRLRLIEPLGYLDFLALQHKAALVLTDSGGVQEETTFLGVPCLTMRPNTERPVTIEMGTNRLVGAEPGGLARKALESLGAPGGARRIPDLWDGRAAERIVKVFRACPRE